MFFIKKIVIYAQFYVKQVKRQLNKTNRWIVF